MSVGTKARSSARTPGAMAAAGVMDTTVHRSPAEHPATSGLSGQPRRRDALNGAAAAVHADVDPDDQAATQRRGKSRRTWCRARAEGPRELRAFQAYLFETPEPYRLEAHVKSLVKQVAIRKLSRPQLVERFHELRAREKEIEGGDNANDVRRGLSWLDRAAQKERDAAIEEELAAVMREFGARGITEDEVFGGSR